MRPKPTYERSIVFTGAGFGALQTHIFDGGEDEEAAILLGGSFLGHR